jgi:hypothetical protein
MVLASLVLLASLTIATPSGGVYVVASDGTGDFSNLQTALDTVPPDSTLVLFPRMDAWGNVLPWDSALVSHGVTIVGALGPGGEVPAIGGTTGVGYFPPSLYGAALAIATGRDAVVKLADLDIGIANWLDVPEYGIGVQSVGDLVIDHCTVWGTPAQMQAYPLFIDGPHAILVNYPVHRVLITDSAIYGAEGTALSNIGDDGCHDVSDVTGGFGGDAVCAPETDLVVICDSLLYGGRGGLGDWGDFAYGEPCGVNGPDSLRGGRGGSCVHGDAYVSHGVLVPGAGGSFNFRDTDWGNGEKGEDGAPASGGSLTDLPDLLAVAGDAKVGATLTFTGSGFQPAGPCFIFVANSIGTPLPLRQGTWFLRWPFVFGGIVVADPLGAISFGGQIPDLPELVGVGFVVQVTNLATLSEPTSVVIGPR